MDQENYEYLTERLKYSGFEDKLNKDLLEQIQSGKPEFQLGKSVEMDGKKVDFNLYFKKSELSERYFFNKMDVGLEDAKGEYKSQVFYQNQGITVKEAFNLLEGRAVHKSMLNAEKEPYKAWLQLDFSKKEENGNFKMNQYHENYGFDLMAKLRELPIVELNDQTKTEWLVKSLQKGNQYPVSMQRGTGEEIMLLEASPKFKSLNVFDATLTPVRTDSIKNGLESKEGETRGLAKGPEAEPDKKKVNTQAETDGESTGRKKNIGVENSKTLPQTPRIPKVGKGKSV